MLRSFSAPLALLGLICASALLPAPTAQAQKLAAANLAPEKKNFYFGGLDDRRVLFSWGRDLTLAPKQNGPPVNLFIRAYVEVDGVPYTGFDRTLTFVSQPEPSAALASAAH